MLKNCDVFRAFFVAPFLFVSVVTVSCSVLLISGFYQPKFSQDCIHSFPDVGKVLGSAPRISDWSHGPTDKASVYGQHTFACHETESLFVGLRKTQLFLALTSIERGNRRFPVRFGWTILVALIIECPGVIAHNFLLQAKTPAVDRGELQHQHGC